MKKLRCKICDCSCSDLKKIAEKSGFIVAEGARHCKVIATDGKLITTIPRHNYINPFTVKGIIKDLNNFGADVEIC